MKIRDRVRVIEKVKFNFRHYGKYKLYTCRVYLRSSQYMEPLNG